VRFLPIVLTTLTAIGGLPPLPLQGTPLSLPLARVIIGGLVSSTLLARLVTPVMYTLLAARDEPVGVGAAPLLAPALHARMNRIKGSESVETKFRRTLTAFDPHLTA